MTRLTDSFQNFPVGASIFLVNMKLDVDALRYLSKDDFRVLTAVEMGMRNVRSLLPAFFLSSSVRFIGLTSLVSFGSMRLSHLNSLIALLASSKKILSFL